MKNLCKKELCINWEQCKLEIDKISDNDLREFILEQRHIFNCTRLPSQDSSKEENPAWVLAEELTKSRPYCVEDFERKYPYYDKASF